MTAIVGVRDRETNKVGANMVWNTDKATLQGFVADHVAGRRDRLHRRCPRLQGNAFQPRSRHTLAFRVRERRRAYQQNRVPVVYDEACPQGNDPQVVTEAS